MKQSALGMRLLRLVANKGLRIFSMRNLRELGGYSRGLPEVLHYLAKEGWIVRLKRGTYAFSPESGFGTPPHEFEIAMHLVHPSAISHWTAMHYHHLTQQTPHTIFALTPTSSSIPRSLLKRHFCYIKIKKALFFGFQTIWINEAKVEITDPERTLLDGLMSPQYCGDFQEVFHAFEVHLNQLNLALLIQYALKMGAAAVKRLGWILDRLGVDQQTLAPLLQFPIKGYRKLDAVGPSKGSYAKKWRIHENLSL